MSRVTGLPRGIAWDPVDGADDYYVHVDFSDSPDFLVDVDSGEHMHLAVVTEPQFLFHSIPGTDFNGADFAVVAHANQDGVDVYSDPASPTGFQDVPLAFTPLESPANGRLLTA